MRACPALALLAAISYSTAVGDEFDAQSTPPAVDFATQIAPIFRQHCIDCHGDESPESGFQLVNHQTAQAGGYSGKAILPGNSAASLLFLLVSAAHEDGLVMPPEDERLSPAQIELLRAWIDQGADWPTDVTLGEASPLANKAEHWAYQPIVKPALPEVKQQTWIRQPLDHFILRRLEDEQVEPAPAADKTTLLRRVTLDLIGLPPTPAEVHAFLQDKSPEAYERVVQRLLDSPHYGERWARPWLDLCHFAESDGYLTDQLRPVAWRYRQWVVDAINHDLPFDQFTIEQLAGDLLPAATTQQRIATGFLRQTLSNREGGADLEEFRVAQVLDRTIMLGTVWLGLTVGCAQCHDHKYDAIRQKEFYELLAFFDSADEINIDAPLPAEAEPFQAALQQYEQQRQDLIAPHREQIEQLQKRWEAKLLHAYRNPGQDHVWDRQWEVLGLVWGGGLGEGQLEGVQIVKLGWSQRTPEQQSRLLDYFLNSGEVVDPNRYKELGLGELNSQLIKLKDDLPHATRAPVMHQTQIPRPVHLFVRGDYRAPGIAVNPATPPWLPPLENPEHADRLALARWLVSPQHPLTARVAVNRAWQEFFGRGLVATSGDFGTQGELPSHPELLDWLAWQFREHGWSTKQLHRSIVTSATYRQSSHARPELGDPNNRLLARQSSLRLSAEQVRDATLAVSGLLSTKFGGPSVFPPQPDSVGMEGFDVQWEPSTGEDRYRRALYTFTRRQAPFAQNVTFDGPDPSRSCTRRQRSNTPLQALTLLNDPVFFEAAQALAARLLKQSPADFNQRLERLFLLCLARLPAEEESRELAAYWQQQLEIVREDQQAAALLAPATLFGKEGSPEDAAWTGLASVVLNLHEFIVRE
ncbi:MAG: PSD1 domain-containing protein [Planctomycetales bacterium]|nr:PSD1 domain-containing protein [Planctomycetales bacterium]